MKAYEIQEQTQAPDGIGGHTEAWQTVETIDGFLDLQTGNHYQAERNAVIEESTHVLVTLEYTADITQKQRLKDPRTGAVYVITYADNPVGIEDHNELYLRYDGQEAEAEPNEP